RNDIGGVSALLHPDTGRAQVFIYDAYPGGIGIAEKGFSMITELWQATLRVIAECPCQEGCPSCIQSPKCGNNNKPLDKVKSVRRSANSEATNLFTELVSRDTRTLTFARTRRLTELIYIYSQRRLAEVSPGRSNQIKPYRAGYLPQERRQIEHELFSGQLLGVVATNALELGIDIGDLEATVLAGYPGSIASTWQQAGRSGRSRGESLSFLVALDNPLDQYFMRHPDSFFQKSFENALVNPGNPYILRAHLMCAAWECPLSNDDEKIFGSTLSQEREVLE
ncbi:unnamed protein product, partial [marine sediment metagenome]